MSKKHAILGGSPLFNNTIQQQNYLPEWSKFTEMIDGIFTRKYYTNHGLLAQEFEKRLSGFLEVKHAICMTNTGIALMIASKALGLKGKVIIPAFSHISVSQAVIWAGLEPVFCDAKQETCHLNTDLLPALIDENTSAILGVNLFGGSCEYEKIEEIASRFSVKNHFVSSDAIGQYYRENKIGNFGSCEIFSLHESSIVNSTDGCVITTNDDFIAARLRNIRSSYGSGPLVPIEFTGNGRMSEVQAGMGLLTLEGVDKNSQQNMEIVEIYENNLENLIGVEVFKPGNFIHNRNCQKCIINIHKNEFGMSAAKLSQALRMENIVVNGFNQYASNPRQPFDSLSGVPIALELSNSLLEFPVNGITKSEVKMICEIMSRIQSDVDKIKMVLND